MHEKVFRLEVAVDDGVTMQHRYCRASLVEEHCGFLFSQCCGLSGKQIAEMSVECALHDDIEVEKVIEVAIHFDYVGVRDEHLQLQLARHLLSHSSCCHFSLCKYLNCAGQASTLLYCKHNSAESPLSQLLHNQEILDACSASQHIVEAFARSAGTEKSRHFAHIAVVGVLALRVKTWLLNERVSEIWARVFLRMVG